MDMEDLTNQVEIIFHPNDEEVDPLAMDEEEMMELEEAARFAVSQSGEIVAQPIASTSRTAYSEFRQIPARKHTTKVEVPYQILPELEATLGEDGSFTVHDYGSYYQEEEGSGTTEQPAAADDAEDNEWEETMIYVDLDDIPSIQELFAVEPDDFLTCQTKRMRERVKPPKPTRPSLKLKFYNFDGENPILQIGSRYYAGKYAEPFGSSLFFREKQFSPSSPSTSKATSRPKTVLKKLTSDIVPPPDPVFGEHLAPETEYELVANVQKVLKMTRKNVIMQRADRDSESRPKKSVPIKTEGFTFEEAVAYKYEPKIDVNLGLVLPPKRIVVRHPVDPLAFTKEELKKQAQSNQSTSSSSSSGDPFSEDRKLIPDVTMID